MKRNRFTGKHLCRLATDVFWGPNACAHTATTHPVSQSKDCWTIVEAGWIYADGLPLAAHGYSRSLLPWSEKH